MRATFAERVQQLVFNHDIAVIYNADQTAVNYEYLPTKTINGINEKAVWVKCGGKTKERVTAMVLADTTGAKHPLFLVLRTTKSKFKAVVQDSLKQRQGFGKLLWKSVEPLQVQYDCHIYGNPTAWWNSKISLEFLEFNFARRLDRATKKVLLLWDDFSAHFTDKVVAYAKSINVVLERIPPRFTWICQPADVAWNRPLKSRLREKWLDLLRRQIQRSKTTTSKFKMQPPSRSTVVSWFTSAWSDLPESTILNGFVACHLLVGEVQEVVDGEGFVDDDVLEELMQGLAVEEVIDPASDIGHCDDIPESQQ
ncbi:hypothetical protein DYB35_012092 [Aphanomyces astaci]|uniref:DDE-1 domain-containing protein n=2 Tax=Aphanomyces astaci TaxID=112090 RepID=A0A3R6Y4P4_APHAT|nr:hypothetical protein DYB35_012092 [Aphanomyces astaci]